jgi:hypothetical protein
VTANPRKSRKAFHDQLPSHGGPPLPLVRAQVTARALSGPQAARPRRSPWRITRECIVDSVRTCPHACCFPECAGSVSLRTPHVVGAILVTGRQRCYGGSRARSVFAKVNAASLPLATERAAASLSCLVLCKGDRRHRSDSRRKSLLRRTLTLSRVESVRPVFQNTNIGPAYARTTEFFSDRQRTDSRFSIRLRDVLDRRAYVCLKLCLRCSTRALTARGTCAVQGRIA